MHRCNRSMRGKFMKTYIVDWGKKCNGGRYALIQAESLEDAWWDADAVGSPFRIALLKIPKGCPEEGRRYIEIDAPKTCYTGPSLNDLKWEKSGESGPFA
jgi:hypothetical protein